MPQTHLSAAFLYGALTPMLGPKEVTALKEKLQRKAEVLSEVTEEMVRRDGRSLPLPSK
jgi:hypothetical protein